MRNGTPGFRAERLVEARDSRGLTQVALAELIGRTSSSISRWEGGDQLPEPDALEGLSRALNVPVSFFLQEQPAHGATPMFFRSMASTTQSARKRCRARMRWAQDVSISLQEWVDLPDVTVPKLDVRDHRLIRDEDIENIAAACRAEWGLGVGPISDILLILENAGAIVIKEEVGTSKMDGLSNWSSADGRPYILVAKDKESCVRSRMDAAHELGHLVLHHSIDGKALNSAGDFKEIERQAFYFAACFLLPAESFAQEVFTPSLNTFLAMKERWKVSVGAMIMRCSGLGMTGDDYDRRLWKHYSARGWRKKEPLDDVLIPEIPRVLARSVKLLVEEGVRSRQDLLSDFRMAATDVESLCSLPQGYLSADSAEIVALPSLKKRAMQSLDAGVVVPFKR